jgi:4-amino-4-deoxy-L-arabinose transferase-like glycosyltransferase
MLVFTLPSQRSGRYIIPAMPALAVLLAIYADRIHRVWWLLTLALIASAAAALGWVAYSLNTVFPVGLGFSPFYFAAVGVLLLVCFVALLSARFRVMLTAASAVAWLALLGALTAPFDRGLGRFDTRVTQVVAGQKMMVPQNFNAQFERFQFALTTVPRVQPLPYMASESITAESLLQQAPFAVIIRPLGVPKPAADARSYSILATRLTLRGRQNPSEITWDSLTDAKALAHLLVEREVLIGTKN